MDIEKNNLNYCFYNVITLPLGSPDYEISLSNNPWTFAFIYIKKYPKTLFCKWSDSKRGVFKNICKLLPII